jgi:hypothetical protein
MSKQQDEAEPVEAGDQAPGMGANYAETDAWDRAQAAKAEEAAAAEAEGDAEAEAE